MNAINPATQPVARCQCGYELFDRQNCPECGLPHHQAITRPARSSLWVASVMLLFSTGVLLPAFTCTCGKLGREVLPVTFVLALGAWHPFCCANETRLIPRFLIALAVIATTYGFAGNLLDVMWFGHDPLFR